MLSTGASMEKHNADHDYQVMLPDTIELQGRATASLPVSLEVGENLPPSDENRNDYCGFIYFENVNDPQDTYRVPYHFVNQLVISQMTVEPGHLSYSPGGNNEVTFSFVLSRLVNDLRFRFHGHATTSYFGNTGPLAAGSHTVVWDGTFDDPEFVIPEGVYAVYPQYQLEAGGTYRNMLNTGNQTSPALAYLLIDNTAPKLLDVGVRIADVENHLRISGKVDDMIRDTLYDVASVYLSGTRLETYNEADISGPGRGYDFTCFEADLPVDLHAAQVVFSLEARDNAGNSNLQEHVITPLVVDNPIRDTADDDVYTVSGRVIRGMTVSVAGVDATVEADGTFSATVNVPDAVNFIDIIADVPEWANFEPLVHRLQVERAGSAAVEIKFTPRTFNLKSNGNWVNLEIVAPGGSNFVSSDIANARLLINGVALSAAHGSANKSKLQLKFDAGAVAELFATPGEKTVTFAGTVAGQPVYGQDTVRVISPGK